MSIRRGWIAQFLFVLAMINYIDRISLSIAAKPIAQEVKLSAAGMGYGWAFGFADVLVLLGACFTLTMTLRPIIEHLVASEVLAVQAQLG